MVSFKELCGLTPAANMKQCILTVSTWLLHSDSAPSVTLNLAEQYPPMEAQGPIPDLLRKVLTAYETVSAVLPGLSSSGRLPGGTGGTGTSTLPRTGGPELAVPILRQGKVSGFHGAAQRGVLSRNRLAQISLTPVPCPDLIR